MKRKIIGVFLLLWGTTLFSQVIIPQPLKQVVKRGNGIVPEVISIECYEDFEISEKAAERWASEVGVSIKDEVGETPWLSIKKDASVEEQEGYRLSISAQGVRIVASTDRGAFYGVQTLRLMSDLSQSPVVLPWVEVEDAPRFSYRGVMLDSSRHFQSLVVIKRLLDQMAFLKLNKFHWHLVDNNGWRIPISSYPQLSELGGDKLWNTLEVERNGAYTVEEIREIVVYASQLNIEIIPEIDIPGHSGALLEIFPEFLCPTNRDKAPVSDVSKRQGNFDYHEILCIGNPDLYAFLETVFKETIELFGSKKIHIGGDEVGEGIWEYCPLCSEKMKGFPREKEYMMQRAFLTDICEMLKKYDVQVINWAERVELGLPDVDITQVWRGGRFSHQRDAIKQGVSVINSFDTYAYFDYPDYLGTCKSAWMPLLSLKKVYKYRIIPIGYTSAQKKLIIGGECALWSEEILESDLDKTLFPRLLAFSEQMWSVDKNRRWLSFKRRLPQIQSMLEARGVEFSTPVDRNKIAPKGWQVTAPLHRRNSYSQYAIDGNDVTAYIGSGNAKSGDTLLLLLPEVKKVNRIEVITGGYYLHSAKDSQLNGAIVEVSSNGIDFESIGTLVLGQLGVDLENREIKAVRIRCMQDYDFPMAVNEIRIK